MKIKDIDDPNVPVEPEEPIEPIEPVKKKVNMNSILESVKSMLDIEVDDGSFDVDIIFGINTCFAILQQLGLGPREGFNVVDSTQEWTDYAEGSMMSMLQQYVYLKTKVIFDPPNNSYLLTNYNERIAELEWRLREVAEGIFNEEEKSCL